MQKNIFVIGSKGIPARYGGFETFVENLIIHRVDTSIQYHIAVLNDPKGDHIVHNAVCFGVRVPNIGHAKAIYYDIAALFHVLHVIKTQKLEYAIVYVLACRIGPFFSYFVRRLHHSGATVVVNPDGHEWLRGKWNVAIRQNWKLSERLMVKHADLLVCDSKAIEHYILAQYAHYKPKTNYIAYGVDVCPSEGKEAAFQEWCLGMGIVPDDYYLVVGRFVPENNLETILREFVASATRRQLVILTNTEENRFMKQLRNNTHFDRDQRVVFAGTMYDRALLKRIREGAVAYLHGHEVGGTNPSLLEALASTKVNLLLDVSFNREVGLDGALYYTKEHGNLKALLEQVDSMQEAEADILAKLAKQRILDSYQNNNITEQYESLWRAVVNSNCERG